MSFITNIGATAVQALVEAFTFIFQYVAGYLVTWTGKLVNFTLNLNVNYLVGDEQLEIIGIGWTIVRDIANLGFVLAIIMIAIATILRFQEYGAKKLLPKLIAAAILVNFSLAIAGGILAFSHTVTDFFINTQLQQGANAVGESITSAFGPQRFFTNDVAGFENAPPPSETGDTGFSGAALSSIAGAIFTVAFTFLAIITLGALAVMLLIRFVTIAILLIISPIAWLLWVVPSMSKHFKEWWDNFFKWTFFAPAMGFFIYLALISVDELANTGAQSVGTGFTGGLTNIMTQGSQMVVVAALLLGGLLAADKLGIKGADTAMGLAKSGGDWAKGAAARKGKQWGSAPFRRQIKGKSIADRVQDAASEGGLKGLAAKPFAKVAANVKTAGGEDVVKEHEDNLKGKSADQLRATLNTSSSQPKKMAALNKLVKEGKITKENAKDYITESMKNRYERFGRKGDFKALQNAAGMDVDMNMAIQEGDGGKLAGSSDKFIRGKKKKDMKDMPWDDIFEALAKEKDVMGLSYEDGEVQELANNLVRSVATQNPSLAPSILPNMGAEAMEAFRDAYGSAIQQEAKQASDAKNMSKFRELQKIKENFEKSIANYTVGFYGQSGGAGSSNSSGDEG